MLCLSIHIAYSVRNGGLSLEIGTGWLSVNKHINFCSLALFPTADGSCGHNLARQSSILRQTRFWKDFMLDYWAWSYMFRCKTNIFPTLISQQEERHKQPNVSVMATLVNCDWLRTCGLSTEIIFSACGCLHRNIGIWHYGTAIGCLSVSPTNFLWDYCWSLHFSMSIFIIHRSSRNIHNTKKNWVSSTVQRAVGVALFFIILIFLINVKNLPV